MSCRSVFGPLLPVLLLLFALLQHPASSEPALPLPPEQPIRIGRYPAPSPDGSRLCFTYQGNLWVVPVSGGPATRLTANDCYDSNPRWSPDGAWIAFNSDREGGSQVFLIPSVGGPARQVTFHSSPTAVFDWFPDGRSLLVTTSRETRRPAIYRLDAVSGRLRKLVEDESNCLFPALSPDGRWLAYTRGALPDTLRKGYRGSANYDIYVAPADGSAPPRRLTDSDRNDMWPMWSADSRTLYFTSEREGLATVWKQPRDGGSPARVVADAPDAVRYPSLSRNGALLAYEADNRIWTAPAGESGPGKEVRILCRTDERGTRTTYQTYSGTGVSEFALSPDGKRAVVAIRGDLFLVSTERSGETRRVTDTPTRDGDAAWSPDGKTVVFASTRNGSWNLYSYEVGTRETRQLTHGTGTDSDPAYSPDGK
ncbi:MAG TPA: hypothetical protein VFU47_10465, partial [Armatimonadota bacterium]|nr:hypothetical protein [Armatimonadota bacterium]